MSKKIISPCISICKTDPITGFCYGCARTNEEKKIWKDINTTDEWKSENLSKGGKELYNRTWIGTKWIHSYRSALTTVRSVTSLS